MMIEWLLLMKPSMVIKSYFYVTSTLFIAKSISCKNNTKLINIYGAGQFHSTIKYNISN